ncbi:hypothetical protein BJ944DRAFT_259969 [Cunninghamella echinulata]|nr:hypothetical protein BJ944DRAFT_259969 [Cunninghamella echinulata]
MAITVCVRYICYKCNSKTYSQATKLLAHMLKIHKLSFSSRQTRERRPPNDDFAYIHYVTSKMDNDIQIHNGCPSCWFHTSNIVDLKEHMESSHFQHTRKRRLDEGEDASVIASETASSVNSDESQQVSIANSKNCILRFSTVLSSPVINQPHISTIKQLSTIVTIVVAGNRKLDSTLHELIQKQQEEQSQLVTLKKNNPVGYELLNNALEQPLINLPYFLWTFNYDSVLMETCEINFLNAIKFALTFYANNCTYEFKHHSKHERTFWIQYIVPIFEAFSKQTKIIYFNWCEKEVNKSTALKYVDGLGMDKNSNNIILMECSSGEKVADIQHPNDDACKQIHNLIGIFQSYLHQYSYSSITTMKKLKLFGIQSTESNITLTELCLNQANPIHYHYYFPRTAKIPLNYDERYRWFPLCELLSYLYINILNQQKVIHQLELESCGKITVEQNDTIKSLFLN